jgi:hypothetical protein
LASQGAVELLLADCYVRRDSVAVLAFRGRSADLLLPPSLVRPAQPVGCPVAAAPRWHTASMRPWHWLMGCAGAATRDRVADRRRASIARGSPTGRVPMKTRCRRRGSCAWRASARCCSTFPQPQAPAEQLAQAMGAAYLPPPARPVPRSCRRQCGATLVVHTAAAQRRQRRHSSAPCSSRHFAHLPSYVAALQSSWSGDNVRGALAAAEELTKIRPMPASSAT